MTTTPPRHYYPDRYGTHSTASPMPTALPRHSMLVQLAKAQIAATDTLAMAIQTVSTPEMISSTNMYVVQICSELYVVQIARDRPDWSFPDPKARHNRSEVICVPRISAVVPPDRL